MSMPPMVNTTDSASNHFQTPWFAITPLLSYLYSRWAIWEPACGQGNIVKTLCEAGYTVHGTDILPDRGDVDFVRDDLPTNFYFNAIITNPPFTLKDEFLARCYEIGKPFALLMPLTALEGQKRQALYKKHGLELLIPNRRIPFETPTGKKGKESSPQFLTAWYTWGLNIGRDITFVDLPKIGR